MHLCSTYLMNRLQVCFCDLCNSWMRQVLTKFSTDESVNSMNVFYSAFLFSSLLSIRVSLTKKSNALSS